MKVLFTLCMVFLLAFQSQPKADTWSFPREVAQKVYQFGDVKIVRKRDSTRNSQYPDFSVTIYRKDELRALYRAVSFEHLAASKDNKIFIGVSNDGLPGTAIVIFDRDGALLWELKHHFARLDYCDRSVTRIRQWFPEKAPDIRFEYYEKDEDYRKAGDIKEISIIDCHGKRRTLSEIIEHYVIKNLPQQPQPLSKPTP
ncbi:MAG: hypothetical protein R3229_08555 [Alphaproteobacteria bacterium]|nr:hypothetical protein [Alphaproteobacteria bacterium]